MGDKRKMTKEELKQEAQEYYEDETEGTFQICEDCYWFADAVQTAYVDSAEPREKEIKSLGERCLQLQKDKGELIDKTRELERRIASIRGSHRVDLAKLNARIEQVERLKKENAELKEALKGKRCNCMTYLNFKDLERQLTKAKEIIRDLLGCLYSVEYDRVSDLEQAEQFIKDSEGK
jgi:predicted RNase H-like nuclease (RuvC/YqgF family)